MAYKPSRVITVKCFDVLSSLGGCYGDHIFCAFYLLTSKEHFACPQSEWFYYSDNSVTNASPSVWSHTICASHACECGAETTVFGSSYFPEPCPCCLRLIDSTSQGDCSEPFTVPRVFLLGLVTAAFLVRGKAHTFSLSVRHPVRRIACNELGLPSLLSSSCCPGLGGSPEGDGTEPRMLSSCLLQLTRCGSSCSCRRNLFRFPASIQRRNKILGNVSLLSPSKRIAEGYKFSPLFEFLYDLYTPFFLFLCVFLHQWVDHWSLEKATSPPDVRALWAGSLG